MEDLDTDTLFPQALSAPLQTEHTSVLLSSYQEESHVFEEEAYELDADVDGVVSESFEDAGAFLSVPFSAGN